MIPVDGINIVISKLKIGLEVRLHTYKYCCLIYVGKVELMDTKD